MSATAERKPSIDPSEQAWAIHNILATLYVALPDDVDEAGVPTRCLLSHVLSLTEPLAIELMELVTQRTGGAK